MPRIYGNKWGHFHPVTGAINVSPDNYVAGADAEAHIAHELWGESTLVAGVTARMDKSVNARKYQYNDFTTCCGGRISEVLNDQKGALMESEDTLNTQFGVFAQETLKPNDKTLLDVSLRYDRSRFDIDKNETTTYDYSTATYIAGEGQVKFAKVFDLLSARMGGSYALNESTNIYGNIARSDQVPSNSEIETNTALQASTTSLIETGAKGRQASLSYDAAVYYSTVTDEIVSVVDSGKTTYKNAGEVRKMGFEFAGNYDLTDQFSFGANYAYTDIEFIVFNEPVSGVNKSRAGNSMPYVPKHQYSLSLNYDSGSGLKGAVRTESWSEYYMDNANTDKYRGYKFITNANIGYDFSDSQSISLNIGNLFDKRYAIEAKKSATGTVSYAAGQPRTFMVSYRHNF